MHRGQDETSRLLAMRVLSGTAVILYIHNITRGDSCKPSRLVKCTYFDLEITVLRIS